MTIPDGVCKTDEATFGPDIGCGFLEAAPEMPLVIWPVATELNRLNVLTGWIDRHIEALSSAAAHWGAVLLRGFDVKDSRSFEAALEHFPAYELGYEAGATVRANITGRVFEATRIPSDIWIMLHQEMAYMRRYPTKIAFYCRRSPEIGGETIIGNMRRFTNALPAKFFEEIKTKGVRYKRNFLSASTHDGRNNPAFAHRTWEQAFYTDDRQKVEADCLARGLDYEWLPDGSITTWNTLPGIALHPLTEDAVYFSQLHTQVPHQRWMGSTRWESYSAVYRPGIARPFDASFGDGSPITDNDLHAIYDALDAVTVRFPWHEGDIMLVDNIVTAHGRNPYHGHREVEVMLLA